VTPCHAPDTFYVLVNARTSTVAGPVHEKFSIAAHLLLYLIEAWVADGV
jgi:hypothetical protein